MSLIMEALKKAQQIRSKDSKETPFLRSYSSERKGPKRWPWFLLSSCLILFVLLIGVWKLLLIPSPPPSTIKIVKEIHPPPPAERVTPDPIKEEKKPELKEEVKPHQPLNQLATPETAKSEQIKLAISEKARPPIPMRQSPMEKQESPPPQEGKAIPETSSSPPRSSQERLSQEKPPQEKLSQGKPTLSPPPNEEVLSKPVVTVQFPGKNRPFSIETIQHFNAGVAYYNQGEVAKAIQAYQKVIELDPGHIEAYNNLGIIYQETGKPENALQAYLKAIEINPHYEKAHNNLGILFYLKGEDDRAMEAFQKVLSINPNHIGSHIHLGTLYKKKGQMERAIESYQKALARDPLHGETHYNLGLLYEQTGNRERAIQHYRQFIHSSSTAYPELASKVRRHIQQLMKTKDGKKE